MLIELKNINKTYDNGQPLHVLKGIDLGIEKGEFVSIMGASGSGKSTLLNILGILDDYDDGEYWLDGKLIKNLNEKVSARYRNEMIGFIFQSFNLISFKTAVLRKDGELRQVRLRDTPQCFSFRHKQNNEVAMPDILEEIYEQAVMVKPSIDAEKTRLDYAKANLAYTKSAYYPTISLSGGVGSSYYKTSGFVNSSFFDQMKHNFSEYLGVSLSVPIFNRFSTRNNVRTAELGIRNQQLVVENAKKTLYKEIQQAYYNAVAAQGKLRSSAQAAKSASEAFELVKAKYENGKANITEYNESKNSMYSAMSDLVQARYECRYQCKLLDFYKGEDLDF